MANERKWRETKLPQWVRDQIESELVSASLAWPTEAEPAPMPFQWGGYDRISGVPVPGEYWDQWMSFFRLDAAEGKYTEWQFTSGDGRKLGAVRGPLYATKRDATLAALWRECRLAAKKLHEIRSKL